MDMSSVSLFLEMGKVKKQKKKKLITQGISYRGLNWAQVVEASSIKQN